jgi:TetR/AcrR family tetracycline transcriptional repressor
VTRGLTKPAIVQAALDALDETGLDGLTLRIVAGRLGVQAPALYWHVHNKQELIDEMATEIWRQVGASVAMLPDDLPWHERMTAYAHALRQAMLARRDGAKMVSGTYLTDVEVLQSQEGVFAHMVGEGFTLAEVVRAYQLLHHFTIGYCIEEQSVAQARASGDDRYSLEHRAQRIDGTAHPLVTEAGPEIFGDYDQGYADILAMIISAVDRLRAPGR